MDAKQVPQSQVPHGKRTPRSSVSSSPDRNIPEKPVPHYLKPTISSSHDSCRTSKKKAAETDPKIRLASRSFSEKNPSHKIPASPSSKEKPAKSLSPAMKIPTLMKSYSDKLPKMGRNLNVKPSPIKAKSPILGRSNSGRREAKPAVGTTDSIPKTETLIQNEDEEKGIENEMEHDVGKEEPGASEEQIMPNESPIDSTNTEVSVFEEEKPENCSIENPSGSPCSSLEEQESVAKVEEETETVKSNDEEENQHVVNEEVKEIPDNSEERGACEEEDGVQGEDNVSCSKMGEAEGEEVRRLGVRQGSGINNDKNGENVERRMKFKVREEVEVGDGGSDEPENVVLRPSDVQGKKEATVFNDVIEETSKKLMQSKRGKVLALAGAFETVISLEAQGSNAKENEGVRNVEENKKVHVEENKKGGLGGSDETVVSLEGQVSNVMDNEGGSNADENKE